VPAIQTPLAQNPEVEAGIRLLEAWVASRMAYRGLPGLSLGIVHDQELVWARGFGQADVDRQVPAAPDTIYRIASISKLFTSTAILQLRDAGRLRLDDPVADHLPGCRLGRPAEGPAVTIRHLLTHTAGLPREAAFPYWSDEVFPTAAEVMAGLARQEAVYPPETRWKYSNLGLTLAGELVAAVAGEPYAAYVQRRILGPLGMESTSVGVADDRRGRLATGYGRRMPDGTRALRPFTDARGIDPAAGIAATVEDLARFAMLQFRDGPAGGRQILAGRTLREMQRPHWVEPDWKSGWGLGFKVIHRADRDLVGHGGWVAGYQTAFFFSPKEKVAVIALTNADDGAPYPDAPESVVDRAFQWVAPALARAAAPPPVPAEPHPEWERYTGLYRRPWGDTQVLLLAGRLAVIAPTAADPSESLATLVPVAPHTFRLEGGDPGGCHGELVVFELDADGRVVRMKVGENYTYPAT
jgi:CubicO group peptidase (beta-lactamase class C family)